MTETELKPPTSPPAAAATAGSTLPEHESYTTYTFSRDAELKQHREAELKRRTAQCTAAKQLALVFLTYSVCFWFVWMGGACILSIFARDPNKLWVSVGENSKWAAGVWGVVAVVGMIYGGVLVRREGMEKAGNRV